jgi:N-methylhydantoinase A
VLSRINADRPIGLTHLQRLDVAGARQAIGALGEKIGLGVEETAEAILTIVNHRMAGRTRLLSVEAGYDPREFALVAFGGAGPLHGASIMREVGIGTMLLPPHPGVLCAVGCAIADIRYDLSQTVERPLAQLESGWITEVLEEQRRSGERSLAASEMALDTVLVTHAAEMSYVGQIHALRVPVEAGWDHARLTRAFAEAYAREYGNTLGDLPLSVVALKTVVQGVRRHGDTGPSEAAAAVPAPVSARRPVYYFGQWLDTPVYDRTQFKPGMFLTGPAIIEQPDTTSVIEPGMRARVDSFNNILVEVA